MGPAIENGSARDLNDCSHRRGAHWLPEETEISPAFVPRSVWRIVRAKDKVLHLSIRGWGSLSMLWLMAQNAEGDEDVLVAALAVLAVAFCNKIGKTASTRV